MSKWNIYSKGTPTSGTPKYVADKLEYRDVWMGEEYVSVSISSPVPLELEIGDYLVYRGMTYSIYSLPSALKQARIGSYGEAFKYENVKFSARSMELTDIRFHDVVLGDNEMHYTSLSTFSFYCETVDDLVDRLQANTNKAGIQWYFITPSYQRTVQRYSDASAAVQAMAVQLWEQFYGNDHNNPDSITDNEKTDINITVDGQSLWNGLEYIKNSFGLNFITRDRACIIGSAGVPTSHMFSYGKGNGLYQIERIAEADQQVVTKLFAYGSDKNLPLRYYATIGDDMPNNMAVNTLMLIGFPTYSLSQLCKSEYDSVNDVTTISVRKTPTSAWSVLMTIGGNHLVGFSTDKLRPFITSPNTSSIGIKEGDIRFTEENDDNGLQEVYPSIEGMTVGDVFGTSSTERLDEILSVDTITDNGVFDGEGTTVPNFHIVLKNIGFDLKEAFDNGGQAMVISMKDGYCGGRNFSVKGVVENDNHTWTLTVERSHDEALDLWFPYSYAAASGGTPSANEAYQIQAGDHFVLTELEISDTNYIWAASVKALRKAITWLLNNDFTRFTYLPKIDEIFMAREHASAPQGTSMHDKLKAGDIMLMEDDDLNVDGSVFIDQITIKENDNADVPTYDIVLRNDKQVGTMQRIQNQLNSLSSFVSGGGGGLSVQQIRQLISSYGSSFFLSKINADTAQKLITFAQGLLSLGDVTLLEKLNVSKDATFAQKIKALGDAIFSENAHSDGFVSGMANGRGWNIDKDGNAEVESLKIRSYLEVIELLINRLQAQEGDTMFSDNDQIDDVEEQTDETDDSVSYILTLKEKWDGYITSQMYGNILKGIVNTLAAKEAGVSDEESTSVETDGSNKYYTSWMRVVATHNTDNTLDVNQIRVVLYGDNDVPAHKNFPPCKMMAIARWGCIDYSSSDSSEYAAEGLSTASAILQSIKKRQTVFYLSSNEGRITKMIGVNKPILEEGNYGMVFGNIPDFIRSWDSWQRLVTEHPHLNDRDYLYAQGLIYEDLVHVDITGAPVPIDVDCGDWVKGDAQGVTPSIGHGIYFNIGWNDNNKQFERHRVRHSNGIWLCLQNQPVVVNGVSTYYEPKFGSAYWKLVDGNGNYSIEFASTMGDAFYVGHVSTTITPHLFFGNVDISADIAVQYWSWKRQTESGETAADIIWNNQHTQTRVLTLTDNDMPTAWGRNNKAIFTCTVVVNDGNNQVVIQNQVIA